jgi:hypothetical protein
MRTHFIRLAVVMLLAGTAVIAQNPPPRQGGPAPAVVDPYPQPINATDAVIRVGLTEFARIPPNGAEPSRMMLLSNEPATRRLFLADMTGLLYSISYDGRSVVKYLDINTPAFAQPVQSMGRERGLNSFAFHPQFGQQGTPGYGKFYTYMDTSNQMPTPDFRPKGEMTTHDTVLLEWTARNPAAATYDGAAPRELMRLRQPFANHNAGLVAFNPLAQPNTPDFGMLYLSVADGGNGGDPLNAAQDPGNAFGKFFRINPLGNNSANKKYGIPADNPFVGNRQALGEIWAVGVRNPQRFGWDPRTGTIYAAEIGQNIIEEITPVPKGGNLGWNAWEASFKFISRTELDLTQRRADPKMTYPVVEFDHRDPLLPSGRSSVTGLVVYRANAIPQLTNKMLFAGMPSGELFYVDADRLPQGGQDAIRRVVFNSGGMAKNLLQVIKEKTPAADRADIRFGTGPDNRIFLLNKADGVVREIVR